MAAPVIIGAAGRRTSEARMNALAPDFQFRADTVTLSGGNVVSMPNRRGADALVTTVGTLAPPAANALLGGAPTLSFTASQCMDSNLTGADWGFLNSQCEVFFVHESTSNVGQFFVGTFMSGLNAGFAFSEPSAGAFAARSLTTAGAFVADAQDVGGVVTNNPTYHNYYLSAASPIQVNLLRREVARSTFATATAAPTVAAAQIPLRLAARGNGTAFANMRFAELLMFKRVLSEFERQLVREYFQARYGIAAPLLAGADRTILSLNPYVFQDPAYYATAAGKVAAFLDRARPGHSFVQATATRQVNNPTADATMNGAMAAVFDGVDDWYASNMPAARWSYMHKPLQTTYFVWTPSAITPTRTAFTTHAGGAPSIRFYVVLDGSGNQQILLANNAGTVVTTLNASGGPVGTAQVLRLKSAATTLTLHRNGVQQASVAATYGTTDTAGTLAIGTVFSTTSANPLLGSQGGLVSFDRELNAQELATFSDAALEKWGKAA